MINKIRYIQSESYDPYHNLALEEYLLLECQPDECILYLWQNQKTIVIGKNQNPWKECLVDKLAEDGGHLVRRLSGGGAVYHDLGNLNFTFLVRKENYDLDKQLDVIIQTVNSLGVHAERTGRNDITADGKKFSGNAFYTRGDHCYHHGTLMVNVVTGDLSKYLTVSEKKLQSKGVSSVKSRVVNLNELSPDITVDVLKTAMVGGFEQVYGLEALPLEEDRICKERLEESINRFGSEEWLYRRNIPFNCQFDERLSDGEISIQFQIDEGLIKDVIIYSDRMDQDTIPVIEEALKGTSYDRVKMADTLTAIGEEEMAEWIKSLDL